jgi:4-hydroxy-3-methylbut-2-en-1-yl diphosphate reductase
MQEIILANPRGFCAGVDRAIEIVERALDLFGAPIYVRHEVVHNRYVVEQLRSRGAVFVEELQDIPAGATVIFSAHGVSQAVRQEAAGRGLQIFDATCPLVTKVHLEVAKYAKDGREVILIGHAGHPEVEGTLGQYTAASPNGKIYLIESVDDVKTLHINDPNTVSFVTQTTLSVDDTAQIIKALRDKYPQIHAPRKEDICYATQNRQDAVKELAKQVDVILVVGSRTSSNSNRLRELADKCGVAAYLVDSADEIDSSWVQGCQKIGVTAGASAPEILVKQVIERLQTWGAGPAHEMSGRIEDVTFSIPKELIRVESRM